MKDFFRKTTKEQLLCLAATIFLAVISFWVSSGRSALSDSNSIVRGQPGSITKQYEFRIKDAEGRNRQIQVKVSPRDFTEEEAAEKIELLMEQLAVFILGENENLNHVEKDLELKKAIAGFEGVRLSWYPEHPSLISYDGKVNNLNLEEMQETSLRVNVRAGEYHEEFVLPVKVYPATELNAEEWMDKLNGLIADADQDSVHEDQLVLPEELDGIGLKFSSPPNNSWIKILLLGIGAVILLGLRPEQERRQQLKKRETELLLDYSDIVSKLVIYMGAGMTVRNAWIKIAESYQEMVQGGTEMPRIAYEEMSKTAGELKQGIPEGRALTDFAGRCSLNCYLKLVSLLEQNRRTGDARSENALLLEAEESFEQRKNVARRLGEEAGTKLMLPLMISLITVMVIVAVPAMMTLT